MFDKNANINWFHVCGQCHNQWYLFKGNSQVGATHPLCRKLVSNGTEPSIVGGEVPRLGTPGASISSRIFISIKLSTGGWNRWIRPVSLRSTPGGSLSAIAMQLSEMRCTFGREFKTSNNLNCQHNSRFWNYYKRIEVVCYLPLHVLCWWKSVQKSYQALSIRFDGWHHILQARWPSFDAMRLYKLLRYGGFTSVLSIIWNCTVAW